MNGSLKILLVMIAAGGVAFAAEGFPAEGFPADDTIQVARAAKDVGLSTDPTSAFWRAARPVYMQKDAQGHPVPDYRTEVRTRWTEKNLYLLFICPYQELNLKPDPKTATETNQLWNWDVAEAFIGSDFKNIRRYKEFEVSPQGEWIDLDIDLDNPHHENGWTWNSGFKVATRIDKTSRVWYAAMKIPYSSIDSRPARVGNMLRANLFRSQGPASQRQQVTWREPMSDSFHVPERFGLLKLVQ
jgi:hypothetical protein